MKTPLLLLGGALAVAGNMANATGTQNIECSGYSERCIIPVYVTPVGGTDCSVRMDFDEIRVNATRIGVPIRVIWMLVKGRRGDSSIYRFEPTKGIDLKNNNTSYDFDNPGHDADEESGGTSPRRFRWISVHKSPSPQPQTYDFVVQRRKSSGGWQQCSSLDPKIVNQ